MAIQTKSITSTVRTNQVFKRGSETVNDIPSGAVVNITVNGQNIYNYQVPENKKCNVTVSVTLNERDA